jgi:hypothetical protein
MKQHSTAIAAKGTPCFWWTFKTLLLVDIQNPASGGYQNPASGGYQNPVLVDIQNSVNSPNALQHSRMMLCGWPPMHGGDCMPASSQKHAARAQKA